MVDDLISRQAAIEAVIKRDANCGIDSAEVLKLLPSAAPERKTGTWIDTGSGQECSECGEIQYGYDNGRHFCANCGADMSGDMMSYNYDPVTDKFTHILDEMPTTATIRIDSIPSAAKIVKQVELTDDCINRIADAMVRKLRGEHE